MYPLASKRGLLSPLGRSVRRAAAGGWWLSGGIAAENCIAAYQAKGAADYAASLVNLANPGTYNAAPGSAPTFDTSTGWYFSGLNKYLVTGVVPDADQTWSIVCAFTSTLLDYKSPMGVKSTGSNLYTLPYYISGRTYWVTGNKSAVIYTGHLESGVTGIAGRNCYSDGVLKATTDASTEAGSTQDIYIGGCNGNGSVTAPFKGYIRAVAIYNTDISSQIAAVSTAMAAL